MTFLLRGRGCEEFSQPQDARKGVLFDSFPPVLQLQLKRFEYDFQRDVMVKVRCFIASTLLLCCEAG